ncbi:hypothetical protein MPSEU_000967600 [Mayamaea pseudoterrestris]|nr:hypothetical protein MPSEU_000967600 [Mayamaea pseudoterrestris]
MSLRSILFSVLILASLLPLAHSLCETELGDMQECLTGNVVAVSSSNNNTEFDAQLCVACLGDQTPSTTSLDCTVNYNFVCTLADVCKETCGDACIDKIEAFGFCTSETFFPGCPQDCSAPPDSGTPEQLQNNTCSVYYNKVVSCLSANSGNSAASPSNTGTCDACIGANALPSSGDCVAASDYACNVASECYQDCGSVCNDELFTFLQCQGDNLAGEQCAYDSCDDTGKPTTGSSAAATMVFKLSAMTALLVFGAFAL